MIQDCLNIFNEYLNTYTESFIWENYTPKDGTYILIEIHDGIFTPKEPVDIIYNKKQGIIEGETNLNYTYIQQLDYCSKLQDMNKSIETKKVIHSNNYLTFFIKKESFPSKLSNEVIDRYYEVLKNPRIKYDKKAAREIYNDIENELGIPDIAMIEEIKDWLNNFLPNLDMDMKRKDYLKLFFILPNKEKTIELYQKEGKRYLIPNIYNNNESNLMAYQTVYGLPNDNLNMNSKKPYLEHKSRKVKEPYLLSLDNVQQQGKFFDYLLGKASLGYVNLYVDLSKKSFQFLKEGEFPKNFKDGLYLRIQKGKEVEIHNFEAVVGYNYFIKPTFAFRAIIPIDNEKFKEKFGPEYGVKTTLKDMQLLVDDVFFSKLLMRNYFTKPEDISIRDGVVKYNLLKARDRLFSWFYKGFTEGLPSLLNHVSMELIKNTFSNGYVTKIKHQLNLRWLLIDYFSMNKDMEERMLQARESLRKHITCKEEDWEFENDEEYFYAVGQLISYYVSLVRAKNVDYSLITPFLNAKKDAVIKKLLINFFKKVSYGIAKKNTRESRLIAHVMTYRSTACIDQDFLLGGFADDNLIYEKNSEVR